MYVLSNQIIFFSSRSENNHGQQDTVKCGDLCVFNRVDDWSKCLIGRITQFSYLAGNKRERQYSSDFVDMTKPSFKTIGVFANWFEGTNYEEIADTVKFKPLDLLFTPGYLSMEHYVCCINDSFLVFDKDFSFSAPTDLLANVLPKWRDRITFDLF